MKNNTYPNESVIKPEWTIFHKGILIVSTLIIWLMYFLKTYKIGFLGWQVTLSVTGLYIDIIGVLIASLKVPFFGHYADGGALQRKSSKTEFNCFKCGMYLIGIGFTLQAAAILASHA